MRQTVYRMNREMDAFRGRVDLFARNSVGTGYERFVAIFNELSPGVQTGDNRPLTRSTRVHTRLIHFFFFSFLRIIFTLILLVTFVPLYQWNYDTWAIRT